MKVTSDINTDIYCELGRLAQSGASLTVKGLLVRALVRPHSFDEISSWQKIYTTILTHPLIQEEGQLSVTGERMGTKYW